jgi:hypothetical protein
LLARHDAVGTAYRFAFSTAGLEEIRPPLDVSFEPLPLDSGNAGVRELVGDTRSDTERLKAQLGLSVNVRGRSRWAVGFAWVSLFLAFGSWAVLLIDLVVDLVRGRVLGTPIWLLPGTVMLATVALWRLWRPRQWFIVPGAIVVGTSTWRSSEWTLQMIRRKEGVLVYWKDVNRIAVASDDGRSFSLKATPEVAEIAIRAWLSPLEPPPLEQLSDLSSDRTPR